MSADSAVVTSFSAAADCSSSAEPVAAAAACPTITQSAFASSCHATVGFAAAALLSVDVGSAIVK